MSVTIRDLQSRPNQPLIRHYKVAPHGWSSDILVNHDVLSLNCVCAECGDTWPLYAIIPFIDRNYAPHAEHYPKTCFECDTDFDNKIVEGWC